MEDLFKDKIISQITIFNGQDCFPISIGGNSQYIRVEDKSLKYENLLHTEYWLIGKDGKIKRVLQNIPVDIQYSDKETNDKA